MILLLLLVESLLVCLEGVRVVVESRLGFQGFDCCEMGVGVGEVEEDRLPSVIGRSFESQTTCGAEPAVDCLDCPTITELPA